MGLFSSKKTRSVVGSSRVIGFLDKTDNACMLAFNSKNIKPLMPHADPAACIVVLQEILSGGDKYFGTSKLKKRSWEIMFDNGRTVCAVKYVGYEATSCGHGLSIPLGDQISQEWNVSVGGVRRFRVIRTRRASNDQ